MAVGGAQGGVRDGLAAHRGAVGDDAVAGAPHLHPVGALRRRVGDGRLPGVGALQLLHGGAGAAVEVVRGVLGGGRAVGLAQVDGVGVGDVLARRGGAPGVVLAAAHLDVHADAGEGDPPGADAGALELLEHHQLRGEVAGLRAEDRDRVAARRAPAGDQQGVGHAALLGAGTGAGERALGDDPVVVDALGLPERGRGLDGRLRVRARGTGAVVDQRLGGDGARVGKSRSDGLAGLVRVRERGAVVDGQHGLGVVALPERLPDLRPLGDAVLLLGGEE